MCKSAEAKVMSIKSHGSQSDQYTNRSEFCLDCTEAWTSFGPTMMPLCMETFSRKKIQVSNIVHLNFLWVIIQTLTHTLHFDDQFHTPSLAVAIQVTHKSFFYKYDLQLQSIL
jgi:hypothetical protein